MPTTPSSDLARQIRASVEEWRIGHPFVAVRVRRPANSTTLTACELWSSGTDRWEPRTMLPAGVGRTFVDIQRAVLAAGYQYSLTGGSQSRAAWRYDANDGRYTLDLQPAPIATAP